MSASNFATVPVRCPSCGQQTHKTMESIVQSGGFVCDCGESVPLDVEQFAHEIRKSEETIRDFGRDS